MTLKWKPSHVGTRVVMGWIGTIGLITCGAVLPVEKAFPGFLALWPILSGALVIIAGRTDHKFAIDRLLTSKPLLNLGNISYALYMVHWPMLVLYSAAVGKPRVSFLRRHRTDCRIDWSGVASESLRGEAPCVRHPITSCRRSSQA